MEKALIEQYKQQMLQMYQSRETPRTVPAAVLEKKPVADNSTGYLSAVVTAVRSLYFVPNARVTVFTGTPEEMTVIDTALTDQNGRITPFALPTPLFSLSLNAENTTTPYSLYNLMIEAEGYLTNIHLNIPVFPSVTSVQPSNLLLLETAGVNKGPRIFDEKPNYNL